MKRFLLSLVFFVLVIYHADGQATFPPAYTITSDTAYQVLLPDSCWQLMADAGGKLTLRQVLYSGHFQDTNRVIDYRYPVYWARLSLVNATGKMVQIALPENAAKVNLYCQLDGGKWTTATTGMMTSWSNRDGLRRIPAFTVTIPSGSKLNVYKRIDWDYVAAQPDSITIGFIFTNKLIQQEYIGNESRFMTSIQDAFILGLFVLSIIFSFYFFLAVREKEFLYFSLFLLMGALESVPTLHDVFLREYPHFLLYLYIVSNSIVGFGLIHSLRLFLKTFKRFPIWDKILVTFSFLQVIGLLSSHFASALFHTNLSSVSHLTYNLFMLVSAIMILITLFLYLRHHDKAIRLMIIAFAPIIFLKGISYLVAVIYGLYYPRMGEPAVSGYATSFNKVGFFILILAYLWMIGLFNWVLFLRFSHIRKMLEKQTLLDNLKSRFFTNISHEFRTPLTLIIGPLEDMIQGGSPERFLSLVPEMHRNSKRLLQLINQLLDLSRLDFGKYHIHTTREDIIPFVRQIVHSFSSLADRKKINLQTEIDTTLRNALNNEEVHFYFDEDIIQKVLNNLLSNAFKFTPEGGEIFASLRLHEAHHGYLELTVEDNGQGIPDDKVAYIFDRFYQADHPAQNLHEGSGVGLSLVKELIALHQGKISVSSRPKQGTIFTCLFPLNTRISSGAVPNQKDTVSTSGSELQELIYDTDKEDDGATENGMASILVVEDNQDVRKYMIEKLQDQYTIKEARNGKTGLEMALAEIPDLVLSDVMMPEMDGFELCKKLKSDDRTSHIPVILLTARAEDADKIHGLETGADAYLIKPFNAKELSVRVRNLIFIRNKMRAKFSEKLLVKPSEITVTSRDKVFMENLIKIIDNHMSDAHFSVEQLGQEIFMSVSQINRKLKALINQSASQLIRSQRMQRAIDMLREDSGSVSEIAFRVGFEDPSYFTKVFKQFFGFLPSEKNQFPH